MVADTLEGMIEPFDAVDIDIKDVLMPTIEGSIDTAIEGSDSVDNDDSYASPPSVAETTFAWWMLRYTSLEFVDSAEMLCGRT